MSKPITLSLTFLILALLLGCGNGSRSQNELEKAQQAVESALNAWKGNQSLKAYASKSSIQISDPDWMIGMKLISYEVQKTEGKDGQNPRCHVVLQLRDRKDKKVDREAIYEVSVDGDRTVVSRELFY